MVKCFIRIRKHRKTKSGVFIIALSVALLLGVVCTMLSAVRKQYESELDTTYESLSNSMFALRNLISFEDSLQSSYESFDLREAKIFTDVARMYFDYNGVTKTSLSDYAYRMGDCEIYFFADNGSEIASDNADKFLLDDDNLRALKTAGVLEAAGHDYTAVPLKGGWLCFQWEDTQALYSVDFERILETCPNDLCVIETATGRVVANSGAEAYDFLNESLVSADSARTAYATDGIEAGFFGGGALSGGTYFVKMQIIDRYTVYAHTPLRTVMSNAMRTVAPEFGLMLLIFVFIWFCAMRMRKQGESIQDQEQCQQFTKDYYINLPVARHTAILLLIGLLMTVAISIHLPLLASYTKHNARMEDNLNSFVSEMQLSDEEWDKISDIFYDLVTDRAMMISEMKDMMGDDFETDELTEIARDMDFVSVVIYDETGTVVMSTDGYIGYTLSQNAEDDEHIIISAEHNETLTRPVLGILARIIPVSLILALAILLMSSVYREIDDWLKDDYTRILSRVFSSDRGSVKKEDTELDETLKKMVKRLVALVFAALIVMYAFDSFFAGNPTSKYLFSNQWEHKVGIFSVTTILLSVAFAVIGVTC